MPQDKRIEFSGLVEPHQMVKQNSFSHYICDVVDDAYTRQMATVPCVVSNLNFDI
jgi:hypothetical protein